MSNNVKFAMKLLKDKLSILGSEITAYCEKTGFIDIVAKNKRYRVVGNRIYTFDSSTLKLVA